MRNETNSDAGAVGVLRHQRPAQAEELIQTTGVKTLDALHLASVLAFQAMSGIRIPFITADIRQRDAASQLNVTAVWIG